MAPHGIGHRSLGIGHSAPPPGGGAPLLCIDIGNTHTHLALHHEGVLSGQRDIPTPLLDDPGQGLPALLANLQTSRALTVFDNPLRTVRGAQASSPAGFGVSPKPAPENVTQPPSPRHAAEALGETPKAAGEDACAPRTAPDLKPAADAPLSRIAFCSVVPAATPRLLAVAAAAGIPAWQLTHQTALGVPITYPRPAEIGQDRLANAAAAHALAPGRPAIVIDLGTAVTFDLVTPEGGYEGGIIAPGPALVTRYLHERTAQLPLVTDLATPVTSVIGKSTAEAIRIGAVVGFAGLIQALLDAVLLEFSRRGLPEAEIFLSGGAAQVVEGRLRQPARIAPDLTLTGLAAAYALNHPG